MRLNPNGSLDPNFGSSGYFLETVTCLEELGDGTILAAGWFSDAMGTPAYSAGLIRLTSNGHLDSSFIVSTGNVGPALVRTLTVQAGGQLFLGGTFRGLDAENVMLFRHDPTFGFFQIPKIPDSYYWIRLKNNGSWLNNLYFENFLRLNNGEVHLTLSGQGHLGFVLEASENLRNWIPIATNIPPNAGLAWRDESSTNLEKRFYRILNP